MAHFDTTRPRRGRGRTGRAGHRRRPAGLPRPHRHRPRPRRAGQPVRRAPSADGVAFCRSIYGTTPHGRRHRHRGRPGRRAARTWSPSRTSSTLQPVPWEPGVAHCIADVYNPDGTPSAESPRHVLQARGRAVRRARHARRWSDPSSSSSSWSATSRRPTGWRRYGEATGNVYVAGLRGDPENVLLRSRCATWPATALEVVAANHEFSSGQFEINLWHSEAAGRRRPGLPVQGRGQGAGPPRGQAGHVHGQAVQRRGRLGLPPALLDVGRRRPRRCSTTRRSPDGLSETAHAGDRRRSSRTPRRWPR